MHDVEVIDGAQPRRRRRAKRVFDPAPFRSLFRMFRWLRAASPDALEELFFRRAFPNQSTRNAKRMVARLVDEGYLAQMRLPHARLAYHLTRRSLATFEEAGIEVPETLRRPPTPEVGGRSWLLSNLRAEHVRQGFEVGRGPPAAYALRRFLLGTPGLDRAVAACVRAESEVEPADDGRVRPLRLSRAVRRAAVHLPDVRNGDPAAAARCLVRVRRVQGNRRRPWPARRVRSDHARDRLPPGRRRVAQAGRPL